MCWPGKNVSDITRYITVSHNQDIELIHIGEAVEYWCQKITPGWKKNLMNALIVPYISVDSITL